MTTDTAFSRAVREFITTPSKKKKASFIDDVLRNRSTVKAQDVQELMQKMEADSLQNRVSRKIVRPVFDAVLDYAGVIDCLSQADPMPTALIWGGMKIVLECFRRYSTLMDKIEEQMKRLGRELRRMKEYEELFMSSTDMQQLLTQSYLAVIRFWVRIETHCKASGLMLAAASMTSSATSKLDEILSEIAENSNSIAKLVPIVQERIRRGEHEDAVAEHRKAGLVLAQILAGQKEEREARRKKEVCHWITGGAELNESNNRHQYQHEKALLAGTGTWLLHDPCFQHWRDPGSGSNVLWLHGGMGVGKSVACANATRMLREQGGQQGEQHQAAAVAVQYFSFDENERLLQLYRHIADQFFHEVYYMTQDELSDEIYGLAQRPATVQSLKSFIQALVAETQTVYLLVDGLDEEYASSERWQAASDVVAFFLEVAQQPGSSLKLWCSSQDRRKVRDLLAGAEQIQLTAATNNQDIAMLFSAALHSPDFEERDDEVKTAVLQSLKRHVNGNFLWARMMLDATSTAVSMRELQATLDSGLPGGFEDYLGRKIRSLKASQHGFLAKVFSCLIYAKRPLLLEELWEALDMADLPAGQNLEPLAFSRRNFLDSCAPLVRVEEVVTGRVRKELCTLSHGSIRSFLVKNPCIFSFDESGRVTPAFLAHACKKYLQQPRYGQLLLKGSGTFVTACGQDILDQPLLGYCAKYWYRHMDDLPYSSELCKDVESFVRSPHYFTCMQVQSILVGGQFVFWSHSQDIASGLHLVRVFPNWFRENKDGKEGRNHSLLAQYHVAIGEWGYYLDQVSALRGLYPGQMHRCWWRSLGRANFLHDCPSSVKSFVFEKSDVQRHGESLYLAEGLSTDRTELRLFKLDVVPESNGSQLRLLCERWSIRSGNRPKLSATFELPVSSASLKQYWSAEHRPITTVAPMAVSECGTLVRVGAEIYRGDESFQFKAEDVQKYDMKFAEEVARKGNYIAITSRGHITEVDEAATSPSAAADPLTANSRESKADSETDNGSNNNSSDSNSNSDSDSDSDSEYDSGNKSDYHSGSREAAKWKEEEAATVVSEDGLDSDLDLEDNSLEDDSHDLGSDFESDSAEENSARESWSEGSTAAMTDEIEDDFVWNEFDEDEINVEDDLDRETDEEDEDLEPDADFDDSDDFDNQVEDKAPEEEPDTASVKSGKSVVSLDSDGGNFLTALLSAIMAGRKAEAKSDDDEEPQSEAEPSDSSDETGLDSQPPSSSDSDSGSEDSYDGGAGMNVAALLETTRRAKTSPQARPCRLCIVRTDEDGRPAEQVFRFSRRAAWPLYASPPVFHPTRPLLVWPLGGNEILFVHYTHNTYFSRIVSSSYPASCEISVQAGFSACGRYMHLAALHGYTARQPATRSNPDGDTDGDTTARMGLRMQLSTYRLSHAKLERSPPRLVHRLAVDLDMFFSPDARLSLSQLPITLSWTPQHLYVAQNQRTLHVMRIPLYTGLPDSLLTTTANTGGVYLPNSVGLRKVYFVPQAEVPPKTKKKSKNKDADEAYVATVLLGAQNTMAEASSRGASTDRFPPQGAHLTAAQLGHWAEALPEPGEGRGPLGGLGSAVALGALRRAETWRGGQLLARYEKFDTNEDCDIVPYLGT